MPDTDFDIFISRYGPEIQTLAFQARTLILETVQGVKEMVDPPSGIVAYGFSSKYADLVCAIAPFPKHINLMLSKGASLPDPDRLLSGTGKRARHIKIQTPEDLQHPGVRKLLTAGAEIVRG